MTTNLHPYPSALLRAIGFALAAGALLIESEGFVQVNAGGIVVLTAKHVPEGWEVTMGRIDS